MASGRSLGNRERTERSLTSDDLCPNSVTVSGKIIRKRPVRPYVFHKLVGLFTPKNRRETSRSILFRYVPLVPMVTA